MQLNNRFRLWNLTNFTNFKGSALTFVEHFCGTLADVKALPLKFVKFVRFVKSLQI